MNKSQRELWRIIELQDSGQAALALVRWQIYKYRQALMRACSTGARWLYQRRDGGECGAIAAMTELCLYCYGRTQEWNFKVGCSCYLEGLWGVRHCMRLLEKFQRTAVIEIDTSAD